MIRLADQDRTRWNRAVIAEEHELVRACLRRNQPGPLQIQAAIAAVHDDAATAATTDWSQIVTLYDLLLVHQPSPVVGLNRAIAIGELDGADAGLRALDAVDDGPLSGYQPYHAARADLLARTGRAELAVEAYERALALTTNVAEREFLVARRDGVRR